MTAKFWKYVMKWKWCVCSVARRELVPYPFQWQEQFLPPSNSPWEPGVWKPQTKPGAVKLWLIAPQSQDWVSCLMFVFDPSSWLGWCDNAAMGNIQGVSYCQYTGCLILGVYSLFYIAGIQFVSYCQYTGSFIFLVHMEFHKAGIQAVLYLVYRYTKCFMKMPDGSQGPLLEI